MPVVGGPELPKPAETGPVTRCSFSPTSPSSVSPWGSCPSSLQLPRLCPQPLLWTRLVPPGPARSFPQCSTQAPVRAGPPAVLYSHGDPEVPPPQTKLSPLPTSGPFSPPGLCLLWSLRCPHLILNPSPPSPPAPPRALPEVRPVSLSALPFLSLPVPLSSRCCRPLARLPLLPLLPGIRAVAGTEALPP